MPNLLDKNIAFLERLHAESKGGRACASEEFKKEKSQEKEKDAKKEPGTIEYMQVTLKIPKACLMYLNEYVLTEAWLEDRLVKAVLAEYEDRSFGTWKADEIGLSPIFWQLLQDKSFHPDLDKRIPMKIK